MTDFTTKLGLRKPEVDVETNWGLRLNENYDILDDTMLLANVSGAGTVSVTDNGSGNVTISGDASASHTHDASDIVSGILIQAQGGTGTSFITGDRAVRSTASGTLLAATTTATELDYLSGTTSAVQTQIDAKADQSELSAASGTLQTDIDTRTGPINGLTGTTTVTGVGLVNTITAGTTITISGTEPNEADLDHGGLSGLGDDDHPQYLNDTRGDAKYVHQALTGFDGITVASGSNTISFTSFRTEFTNASGTLQTDIDGKLENVSGEDHGTLSGLTDDDHSQYVLAAGGRDITGNQVIGGDLTVSGSLIDVAQQLDMHVPEPDAGDVIAMRGYAFYAFDVASMWAELEVATATITVSINGTPITGLSSVAVSTTGGISSATAANSVSVGDKLEVTIDAADTSASGLTIAINATRSS